MDRFVDGINTIAKEQNFYRGNKIEFGGRLRFLDLRSRSWDSIILDPETKRDIKANTTGFLNKRESLAQYGVPPKRGVLLVGEPGTGKTAICKALMAEASDITCIATLSYGLDSNGYVTELYELAQDLSPCIVFIEDIDLIGQNREEFGYHQGSALLSLLAVLDGLEEQEEIVTVATTNRLDVLDRALSQRPSRFDRMIKLSHPSLQQRRELISLLCQRIPLDEPTRDYIARKAEHCTPAQLQEIPYSLVIEHSDESGIAQSPYLESSIEDIDGIISKINGRNRHPLGFNIQSNHNGARSDQIEIIMQE